MKAILAVALLFPAAVYAQQTPAQAPESRLFEAIEAGKQLVAEGIIVKGRVNLDARNKDGETPLHRAIEKGYGAAG